MVKGPKYYVVTVGRNPGIYGTWADCKAQVDNFPGARYKSVPTIDEARLLLRNGIPAPTRTAQLTANSTKNTTKPISQRAGFEPNSISVDAACSGNPGMMEYRGVDNLTQAEIFRLNPAVWGTNNIGEFLAIVHALAWLHKNQSQKTIYSDSVNAINWVKSKTVRTKLPRTADTDYVWQLIDRAVIWLKNNPISCPIKKWETSQWGENPADFGRK